jgi:hypothetical protein
MRFFQTHVTKKYFRPGRLHEKIAVDQIDPSEETVESVFDLENFRPRRVESVGRSIDFISKIFQVEKFFQRGLCDLRVWVGRVRNSIWHLTM